MTTPDTLTADELATLRDYVGIARAREALDLMWSDANGYEVKRAAFDDARAALDELEKELADVPDLRRRATLWEQKYFDAEHRARELEAQLAAQPKPLEWRDPETAPRGTSVHVMLHDGTLRTAYQLYAGMWSVEGDVIGWVPRTEISSPQDAEDTDG